MPMVWHAWKTSNYCSSGRVTGGESENKSEIALQSRYRIEARHSARRGDTPRNQRHGSLEPSAATSPASAATSPASAAKASSAATQAAATATQAATTTEATASKATGSAA